MTLIGRPNITTRGFVLVNDNTELILELENISKKAIEKTLKKPINYTEIKSTIIQDLAPYIYDRTGRKPIILPVLMNIKKNNN
ncbi:MAG: ribonuclease J, partial [Bacilli bacterium]|nr:ribonuclease J [Bacilli bacterium]